MTQQFGLGRSIGVAQGLQGLRANQQQFDVNQMNMQNVQADRAAAQQAAEAEARRKQLLQQKLQGVVNPETGQLDPAGFTDLLLTDPETAGAVREQFGLVDEQRNAQLVNQAFGAKQLIESAGTPEAALQALQNSGLMDDPMFAQLADNLQAGDMQGALNEIGYGVAVAGGPEAYNKIFKPGGEAKIGQYNPRDYTTESFAEFTKSGDPAVLERYANQQSVDIGGVPHVFDPARGGYFPAQVGGQPGADGQPTAGTPVTTETVAGSQGTIAATERAATGAIEASQQAFDQLSDVQSSISTLDEAIGLMESDNPPATGALMSRLPSVRQASIKLDNIQNRLGLNVVSATTFGALSEKELALAMSTALPTNLEGEELTEWLKNKRQSQQKLANYLEEAAVYLGTPGNTVSDFLQMKRENQNKPPEEQVVLQDHPTYGTITEADIQTTMENNGVTREQVLEMLNSGGAK